MNQGEGGAGERATRERRIDWWGRRGKGLRTNLEDAAPNKVLNPGDLLLRDGGHGARRAVELEVLLEQRVLRT